MLDGLVKAIREGNTEEVRSFVIQGVDINQPWSEVIDYGAFLEGVTPLMIAAAAPNSSAEIVQILLNAGAKVKAKSNGDVTAVWYAAGGGTGYPLTEKNLAELGPDHPYLNWGAGGADRLKLLLDAGGDPNDHASNGRSALSEACSVGNANSVRLLLERQASVWPVKHKNFRLPSGTELIIRAVAGVAGSNFTFEVVPLFEAARGGNIECVQLILEAGFPVDYRSGNVTALDGAANLEIAEMLIGKGLKNELGAFGFDMIDKAFDDERYDVAKRLLEMVLPCQRQVVLQQKLMMCSGVRMSPVAVKILLDMGADASIPDSDYGSALHTACWQGDGNGGREDHVVEETLELLIGAGAGIEMWNRHGATPLLEAVDGDWDSPTSVKVLLRHGAKIEVTNQYGQTPLMLAASSGSLESVRLLLAAGANRTTCDSSRKTALDYANASQAIWGSKLKLPLSSRIVNKLLKVDLNLDVRQSEKVRDIDEMIKLLKA